jgi:prepilin-type processing-associated H-X9-DG protein
LAPAVQQVREAARATACRSKLHQLNLAIHNYLELHQYFPSPVFRNEYSYAFKILPHLELTPIFEDFQAGDQDAIYEHLLRPIPALRCPSESGHPETPFVSYFMNYGNQLPDDADIGNGFHGGSRLLTTRDVTDGLSNTAILSEVIVGNLVDPRARYWKLTARSYARGEESAFADDCQSMPQTSSDPNEWFSSGWAYHWFNCYYHILPPNHRSCMILSGHEIRDSASWHAGMVHTAFADGSVRVTTSSIDRAVWRALGSRNGGEVNP